MILVDTSVWIDFFRGTNTPYRGILHELIASDEDICVSGIILTEILQGIKDDRVYNETREYLLEFPLYNSSGAGTWKTIRTTIDCLIAAVAIENDLVLLHKDSDFDNIAQCTKLRVLNKYRGDRTCP